MRVAVVHASGDRGLSGDAGERSEKLESRLMNMCSALGAAGVEAVDIVGERESPHARDQAVADADVVVVCVTAALVELVKAGTHVDFFNAARQKPNKLVPVLLDPKLGNQADWHGGVGLMLGKELYFGMTDDKAVAKVGTQLLGMLEGKAATAALADGGAPFDVFLSHSRLG